MDFTILRDSLYADFMPSLAGEDGVIRGPGGQGRAAVVAQDDIADAAVTVLRDPTRHRGATYDLTGPRAMSLEEIATVVSLATGRPCSYVAESVPEAYRSRASYGAPQWQLDAWVSTYTAIAEGAFSHVSDCVPQLTGHPATELSQLLTR
jgi:uncharacterized protein YbjT (DUF2867 family)